MPPRGTGAPRASFARVMAVGRDHDIAPGVRPCRAPCRGRGAPAGKPRHAKLSACATCQAAHGNGARVWSTAAGHECGARGKAAHRACGAAARWGHRALPPRDTSVGHGGVADGNGHEWRAPQRDTGGRCGWLGVYGNIKNFLLTSSLFSDTKFFDQFTISVDIFFF